MKKTIGFFGGSFDPVHFGHLNLAVQLFEQFHLNEVLFCPAFCSPFKMDAPPIASPHHRLAMLRLCLEDFPQFKETSIEIERKGPSYTIDTIRALNEKDQRIHLLLSEDAAAGLDSWKEAKELLRIAPPLIGIRSSDSSLKGKFKRHTAPMRIMEISSTEIRDRLKKNLCCAHLVPLKALDYIRTHNLYSF